MDKHQTADRDGFSPLLPQTIELTEAETKQVAGGAESGGGPDGLLPSPAA